MGQGVDYVDSFFGVEHQQLLEKVNCFGRGLREKFGKIFSHFMTFGYFFDPELTRLSDVLHALNVWIS
jgi:hypothetical protein